jgi:hypothetical protein
LTIITHDNCSSINETLLKHCKLGWEMNIHWSCQFVFMQTKFLTCSPSLFCPLTYSAQWKEMINFIIHFATYKCLHYNAKIKITTCLLFLGHVIQNWKDLCANLTLTSTKSLQIFSSFVAYWAALFMACQKTCTIKRNKQHVPCNVKCFKRPTVTWWSF